MFIRMMTVWEGRMVREFCEKKALFAKRTGPFTFLGDSHRQRGNPQESIFPNRRR